MTMKILIEGIGGIGGILAGRFLQAGLDVTLITNNETISNRINSAGLTIIEDGKEEIVQGEAYTSLEEASGKFDIIFLVMKATDVVEAARKSLSFLSDSGYMVTMQNGVVEDAVGKIVGQSKIISAIVGWGGTMHSPGIYEKTSPGEIHIGELDGSRTSRLDGLKQILELACPVVITTNIVGALWSKLAINCCVTTLGAITGEKLGVMLSNKQIRSIFLDIYQEVVDTATRKGISLERIAANPYLLYRRKGANFVINWFKLLMLKFVGRKYKELKSSMLQSLDRGRKTEIEFLNGYVVRTAKEVDVPTPRNTKAVEIVERIEKGELQSSMDNIRLFNTD